jgi:hypothetical protein
MNQIPSPVAGATPPRLLSKSNFVRGYDCPVRVKYAVARRASTKQDDEFLRLLAEGGFQFEKLVRHAWPGEEIRGDIKDPLGAHGNTIDAIRSLLAAGGGVLHEATLVHGGRAARVDMLRVLPNAVELCEIKAKSFKGTCDVKDAGRVITSPESDLVGMRGIRSTWLRYLADVAFQTVVAEEALFAAGLGMLTVRPRLILANSNIACGTYDSFANLRIDASRAIKNGRMTSEDVAWVVEPPTHFRSPLIAEVDVTAEVGLLRTGNAKSRSAAWNGKTIVQLIEDATAIATGAHAPDIEPELGFKCRDCEFNALGNDAQSSGFEQCWGKRTQAAKNLVTLYYGKGYVPTAQVAAVGQLKDGAMTGVPEWIVDVIDRHPGSTAITVAGLPYDCGTGSRAATRNMQIAAERTGVPQHAPDLCAEVQQKLLRDGRPCKLHFLDFETSMACLPFAPGMRPYETVAFQFSCHSVPFDGTQPDYTKTSHAQWVNPSDEAAKSVLEDDRAFVDKLAEAIGHDDGPVFHWAVHERTVLNKVIRPRLANAGNSFDSRDVERLAFIDALVGHDGKPARLVDMRPVAEGRVMMPGQKGRYSIKCLLPAICSSELAWSVILRLMKAEFNAAAIGDCRDPYKLLPPIVGIPNLNDGEEADDDADQEQDGGIRCGTAAMRAFQQIRFASATKWGQVNQREMISALERYCKLDTAAMVAVWAWMVGEARSN